MLSQINPPGLSGKILTFASNAITNLVPALCAPFKLPSITANTTGYALSQYGHSYNIENFALLNRFLYPNNNSYTYNTAKIEDYLNTAPCNGPHGTPFYDPNVNPYGRGDRGVYGWRADNRFEKSNEDLDPNSFQGKSNNGLDYMLLYNLYTLVHGDGTGYKSAFSNKLNINLSNQSYPTSNSFSDVSKGTTYAFEKLECSNTVVNAGSTGTANNGNVTYRAGMNIKLGNGFKVKSGANFKAYVDPLYGINCNYNGGLNYTPTSNLRVGEDKEKTKWAFSSTMDTIALQKEFAQKYKEAIVEIESKYSTVKSYTPAEEYIKKHSSTASVVVYPNPNKGIFTLKFSNLLTNATDVVVKNAIGQTVLEMKDILSNSEIDLSEQVDGVYFMYLTSLDKTFKIVKTK